MQKVCDYLLFSSINLVIDLIVQAYSVGLPFRKRMLEAHSTPVVGDNDHQPAFQPEELLRMIRTAAQAKVCGAVAQLAQQWDPAPSPGVPSPSKFSQ